MADRFDCETGRSDSFNFFRCGGYVSPSSERLWPITSAMAGEGVRADGGGGGEQRRQCRKRDAGDSEGRFPDWQGGATGV